MASSINILVNFATMKAGGGQNVALNFLHAIRSIRYESVNCIFMVAKGSEAQRFLANQALVGEWKERARAFRDQIAATNVGDYLTTVLRLAFCREGARPLAPWAKHTATDAVSANDHDRDGTVKI